MNIAIVQPNIPNYREEFFAKLAERCRLQVFTYEDAQAIDAAGFAEAKTITTTKLWCRRLQSAIVFDPYPIVCSRPDVVVLMLQVNQLSTWLILLLRRLMRKKTIVWGHGISVHNYLSEEQNPSQLKKWLISLSSGVWFYTEHEKNIWQKVFPRKPMVALGNTISHVQDILDLKQTSTKQQLRDKHHINAEFVIIFCARFSTAHRRTDLLLKTIQRLDAKRFAFVIIGDGRLKPDFSPYPNVHDFGAVYDRRLKNELFQLSDIYFQPGWVGLSVVEAMAYGKPVFTFRRSPDVKQCVEYSYLQNGRNSMIFENIEHCTSEFNNLTPPLLLTMSRNAKQYVEQNLTMTQMVNRAMNLIDYASSSGRT